MSHLLRRLLDTVVPNGLAVAAFAAAAVLTTPWPAYVLVAITFGFGLYHYGRDGLGQYRVGRVLALGALLLAQVKTQPDGIVPVGLAVTLLCGIIAFEPLLQVALSTRVLQTANLPQHRGEHWLNPRNVYAVVSVMSVAVWLTVVTQVTAWPVAGVCALAACAGAFATVASWRARRRQAHAADAEVFDAVNAHAPKFAIHFAAPSGCEYQLLMWLDYFDALGDPYVIILRDAEFLPKIAAATDTPIVVAPSITQLESLLIDSIKAVFYVNNSMQNTQCVRFAELTHIQLMHGDSDKPPSYNPISAMYDRIFVAGQAGVDRYHNHGIDIPTSRFRIVGHPQVTRVQVSEGGRDPDRAPVALYAPTWTGLSSDANYCSLPLAGDICAALLERGVTMVVRPHPYTRRNPAAARQLDALEKQLAADTAKTGRKHLYGKTTTQQMSLIDCINAADVMVTDASGAASDWLYSEKPYAITDVLGLGDKLADELPLAKGAYVIDSDGRNLAQVCEQLLETDSLASARLKIKTYYLGEFSADEYVEVFAAAARDCYI